MDDKGIRCEITVSIDSGRINHKNEDCLYYDYKHEILIKPRPENEYQLLKKWRQDIPAKFFPPVFKGDVKPNTNFWYTSESDLFWKNGYHQSGGNLISVNGYKCNPWFFIRDGNRKPPAQICPTTAKGWFEIEKQFQPSTLRDEIQLTRMLIEYFDSGNNEEQIKRQDNIVNWLKTLPEPQQISMASWIGERASRGIHISSDSEEYLPKPMREKYLKLAKTVEPMMSNYYQNYFREFFKRRNTK